jgi:isovaleryl-CoA dehydrogenase
MICGVKLIRRKVSCLLSEDQLMLKELVYKFCQQHIAPIASEVDKTDTCDYKSLWPKLGELGLLGMTAPAEYGGTGLGYLDHIVCTEEISRASGSIGLSYIAHSNLCVNQITLHGNDSQKFKYLPDLCGGIKIGALAMSEVGSGSDVISMATKADKVDGGYLINGTKIWITNGPYADVFVVYAKTKLKEKKISTFIIEKNTPGFSIGKKLDKLGMRGSGTSELIFENVFVPNENLLGDEDKGVYILMSGLNYERLVLAAGPVGLMQSALDLVLPYTTQRKQFDKPICEFQAIQFKIADMFTSLNASRSYLYTMGKIADTSSVNNQDCAAVLYFASEAAVKTALEAVQCLGGNGYTNDYSAGRILRDAKLYEIGGGTNEIRKIIIARELTKQYTA